MSPLSLSLLAYIALAQNVAALFVPPVPPPMVQNVHPLGFNSSLIHPLGVNDTVPDITVWNATEHLSNVTSILPSLPRRGQRNDDKRLIVGSDDRTYNAETTYPYAAVGKLTWSNGVWCSGAMVGARHVLTARHCLPTQDDVSGTFTPGFNNGAPFGSGQVELAVIGASGQGACETKADWAVLLINQRLGERVGSFGLAYPSRSSFDQPRMIHQAYPGDRDDGQRPQRHLNTTVYSRNSLDCDSTGPIYSDTDTAGGQSGGPIWEMRSNGPFIWGALSISVSSQMYVYAGWASGNDMVDATMWLRSEYP
ncbi:trypsin-like cysteine/serine peptidase domain-containing protein [Stachybotrys elegans]|uniref:Serine protease n=1 Tax=Stachybotrys elegans TaxID=80388 RepID=A0A8K0WQG1_9HYPO|nr:trypsin-like cysteine/serine peptidase domain-containing protein [Stachybotrys elegans]